VVVTYEVYRNFGIKVALYVVIFEPKDRSFVMLRDKLSIDRRDV